MSRARSCRAPAPSLSPPTSNAIAAANRLTVSPTSNEGTKPAWTKTSSLTLSIELCAWTGGRGVAGFSNLHAPWLTGRYHWRPQIVCRYKEGDAVFIITGSLTRASVSDIAENDGPIGAAVLHGLSASDAMPFRHHRGCFDSRPCRQNGLFRGFERRFV